MITLSPIKAMCSRVTSLLSWQRLFRAGCLAILLAPDATRAAFHLWTVNEVYSSADGSVQFIEMQDVEGAFGGSQQFLKTFGASIKSTNSAGVNTFFFPNDLTSPTLNHTFIIGTSNLASLPGGLKPDYFIPPNFILPPVGGGTAAVIFNPSPANSAIYTNLPVDGDVSLTRSGAIFLNLTNTPKNFFEQSNTIVPVKFLSSTFDGSSNFTMSFRTATGTNFTPGPNYAVQYNDDLTTTNWNTLTNLTGNGTTQIISNATDVAQRFFRLRVP